MHVLSSRPGRISLIGRLAAFVWLVFLMAGAATSSQAQTNPKHFFWAPGQPNTPNPSSLANDLIYHGGNAGAGCNRRRKQTGNISHLLGSGLDQRVYHN